MPWNEATYEAIVLIQNNRNLYHQFTDSNMDQEAFERNLRNYMQQDLESVDWKIVDKHINED